MAVSIAPKGVTILVLVFIFTTLAVIALVLRLWSRRISGTRLVLNDYMAILALIFTIASAVNDLIVVFNGTAGFHVPDILATRPHEFLLFAKLMIPGQILWAAANSTIKISVLSLYTMLFPGRKFHLVCYGLMAATIPFIVTVVVSAFAFCTPVRYNWDKFATVGTCDLHGQQTAFVVSGAINLAMDVLVVALPMPKLFGLKMSLAKRCGLASMFGLGAVTCVVSLLRCIAVADWNMADITYECVETFIYTVVEPCLGLINCCFPVMRPAVLLILGKSPTKSQGYSSGSVWTRESHVKGSSLGGKRLHRNVSDVPLTEFERLSDDMPLAVSHAHAERGAGNLPVKPGEITVQRAWEVHEKR